MCGCRWLIPEGLGLGWGWGQADSSQHVGIVLCSHYNHEGWHGGMVDVVQLSFLGDRLGWQGVEKANKL